MPKEQQRDEYPTHGEAVDLLYLACNVHAAAFNPFLRYGCGTNYPGLHGLLALVALFAMAAGNDDRTFLWFMGLWIVVQAFRRLQILWLIPRKGTVTHSRYSGYPWLAMRLLKVRKEEVARGIVEPMICLVVGVLLCLISETLGLFVMAGFVSLGLGNLIDGMLVRQRVQRLIDAQLEGEHYAGEYRRRRRS